MLGWHVVWVVAAVGVLLLVGSLLAVAEAATSRMTRVRALALHEEGRRNAALLERIQADPSRYLNSVYLAVMIVQNGSAILVAMATEHWFDSLGVMLVSVAFTLVYFVVVEAMSKTFGILHSDRAALATAPFVWLLGRVLALPTRALIGLANVLLPGKGLRQGPFVSEHDIRSMAEVGHEEGAIEEEEKELIHSIFEFGDTVVRDVMVPRPDIDAVEAAVPLGAALDLMTEHGRSRVPVHRGDLDHVEGYLHVKEVLAATRQGRHAAPCAELMRPVQFVPESKKVRALLREMRREKFHLALVIDEYGSTVGLVTLEDLLEELVGDISDEYDQSQPAVEPLADGSYRVSGGLLVEELEKLLQAPLPRNGWNTVGGLLQSVLGALPTQGQEIEVGGLKLTVERVDGKRVTTVRVERTMESRLR
jgi:CBS domain containing-hemolysin-like protein